MNIFKKLKYGSLLSKVKNFGFSKDFSDSIFNNDKNNKQIIEDIKKAKNKDELIGYIHQNYKKYGLLGSGLILGCSCGFNDTCLNGYGVLDRTLKMSKDKCDSLIANDYRIEDTIGLMNDNKEMIINYIKGNNILKNQIRRGIDGDYSKPLSDKYLSALYNSTLNNIISGTPFDSQEKVILQLITNIEAVYTKERIKAKSFIEFEFSSGIFDEQQSNLLGGDNHQSVDERIGNYKKYNGLSAKEIEILRNPSLQSRLGENITIENVRNRYQEYERNYKNRIINGLSKLELKSDVNVINTYDENHVVLGHLFLRDAHVVDSNINQVMIGESKDAISHYTDANGVLGNSYKSNTSKQLSTTIFTMDKILDTGKHIGIIVDPASLTDKHIAVSSAKYLTTNVGIENLEVPKNSQFGLLEAPIEELKNSTGPNEVVLYRSVDGKKIKSACVIAIIDDENDEEIINQTIELAKKNNLKAVIYNKKAIRESKEEKKKGNQNTVIRK